MAATFFHVFSIVLATFSSGASQGLNHFALPPTTLLTPSAQITHFVHIHRAGHLILPVSFILSGLIHFGLAWTGSTSSPTLETVAGAITVAIYPISTMWIEQLYLFLFELEGLSDEVVTEKTRERGGVGRLVERWRWANTARAVLPLVGAGVSAWNLVH